LQKEISYASYEVFGYRFTGKKAMVGGKKVDVYEPIGSFGSLIRYNDPVAKWDFSVLGAEQIGPDLYSMKVKVGEKGYMSVKVKETDPLQYSASIHGGIAYPLPNYSDLFGFGFSVMADFSWRTMPSVRQFSFTTLLGFDYLPAKNSADSASTIINLSLNARWDQELFGPLSVYAQAGPSIYSVDEYIDYGADAGCGLDIHIGQSLALEIGGLYHFIIQDSRQFIQIDAGIVFSF